MMMDVVMEKDASVGASERAPVNIPPRCVMITGSRGAGHEQWLDECLRRLTLQPSNRCGVLLADSGAARRGSGYADTPAIVVRTCYLPCICCPGAVDLRSVVDEIVRVNQANWLFIELPLIAAPGLIAEFDRSIRWPRTIVVCLSEKWAQAQRRGVIPPFQMLLIETADVTISNDKEAAAALAQFAPGETGAGDLPFGLLGATGVRDAAGPVCRRN